MSAFGMPIGKAATRRIVAGLLVMLLAALCLWVLLPFLSPLAWATILAYVSWPAYRRLRRRFGRSDNAAALVMTTLVSCAMFVPLFWFLLLLRSELVGSFSSIAASLVRGLQSIPPRLHELPWLGSLLSTELHRYASDPAAAGRELAGWLQSGMGALAALLGNLSRGISKVLLTILILFFLYRDGARLAREIERATLRLFGVAATRYAKAAGAITRAVFFGVIVAAFAQGLIAGIGYRVVGLPAPALLGAVTGALSILPFFGTALVWAPIGIGFILAGSVWKGLILLGWGVLLVHPTDNLLHAFLVSSATRLPLLLVILGLIGGLAAFGLVGLFLGPLFLGTALELWHEWTRPQDTSLQRDRAVRLR